MGLSFEEDRQEHGLNLPARMASPLALGVSGMSPAWSPHFPEVIGGTGRGLRAGLVVPSVRDAAPSGGPDARRAWGQGAAPPGCLPSEADLPLPLSGSSNPAWSPEQTGWPPSQSLHFHQMPGVVKERCAVSGQVGAQKLLAPASTPP